MSEIGIIVRLLIAIPIGIATYKTGWYDRILPNALKSKHHKNKIYLVDGEGNIREKKKGDR